MNETEQTSDIDREKKAARVTWVGFFTNLILSAAKIVAGVVGRSSAMVADGIHSLSDFVTDFIVIIFIKISSKNEDSDHPYGHGKFETFATMLISFALFIVAIGIFYSGSVKIYEVLNGRTIERPTYLALVMAAVSIVVKEGLYWYTIIIGRKIDSPAVIANGWHHRSDAFSSIGTLIGISGAMFLGERWRILDPITSVIVGIFIIDVAYKLARPSIQELLEMSLPQEIEQKIEQKIQATPGVITFHHLRTRKNGNAFIIDMHIKVDARSSIVEAHDIATHVENNLKAAFGKHTQVNVHIEPYQPKA
ncbi:cation diffusion facilitator family transporter [Barnesiella viscericola]|uniref:cation diffusion facilitator family transporter n=1 Tax=Barnesiella viscericola TaxID=397865 RepID=UPI0025A34C78|nr:cation diffusion facilitator family transporter [Barnesiella viscericola]MDM8267814.1 cation diffusion facilitator family transporter [Barnesiella viscericola]